MIRIISFSLLVVALALTVSLIPAQADLVQFYGVDADDNTIINLTTSTSSSTGNYTLLYSLDDSNWTPLGTNIAINLTGLPVGASRSIYLELLGSGNSTHVGALAFSNPAGQYYSNLTVTWQGIGSDAATSYITGAGDKVSPTPIPGAVWLLGSGLAGLIGLKRKYLG